MAPHRPLAQGFSAVVACYVAGRCGVAPVNAYQGPTTKAGGSNATRMRTLMDIAAATTTSFVLTPSADGLIWIPPLGSPVALHGTLSVSQNRIVDQYGQNVRLRGMSLFWSNWQGQYWNADVVRWLVQDWHVGFLRLAMDITWTGTDGNPDGFLTDPHGQWALVQAVVDECIKQGIYVVIDWHEEDANEHADAAESFFAQAAFIYEGFPNVMYETWNEPTGQDWNTVIKPHHQRIVDAIRQHSNSIVILGTGHWSQDADVASLDPVIGLNLAYTLHFYASTHKEYLRNKTRTALTNGLAVFVSEWGVCEATGNGTLDFDSTREWEAFLATHGIWSANWGVSDKHESCSALRQYASIAGNWPLHNLTEAGFLVRSMLRNEDVGIPCFTEGWPCKAACAAQGGACGNEKCCAAPGENCYAKDSGWAQCMPECTPGINPNDPPAYASPWSCERLDAASPPSGPSSPLFGTQSWAVGATVYAVLATVVVVYLACCRGPRSRSYAATNGDVESEGD